MEEWRDIIGYEGLYQVSSMGRVRNLNYRGTGKNVVLKCVTHQKGYLRTYLMKYKRQKTFWTHRLVLSTFIPNTGNKPQINHKNSIKTDNRLINLEWCSSKENRDHWLKGDSSKGHIPIKLDDKKVEQVKILIVQGVLSNREIGRNFEVSSYTISKIRNNKAWKHVPWPT